jgi:hypothetical protein
LVWKPTVAFGTSPAPSLPPSLPSLPPSLPSLAPSLPSLAPSLASLASLPSLAPSHVNPDMQAPFPFVAAEPEPTPPPIPPSTFKAPPMQDWDLLYIASKQKSRLTPEQVSILTSQTILDMSILPDMRVEEVEELKEDYDMEGKFRHKSGILFSTTNMEEQSKEPDEIQRVKALVSKVYEDDNWEPIVEKTGDHTYEVSELRPRKKEALPPEM